MNHTTKQANQNIFWLNATAIWKLAKIVKFLFSSSDVGNRREFGRWKSPQFGRGKLWQFGCWKLRSSSDGGNHARSDGGNLTRLFITKLEEEN
jgi:hypothetical protein